MIIKNNKRIDGCSDTVPIGTLNPFLGSTAPYGYLICKGQKVSKTVYKELYDICGDTFGQSTDTEFYLPDLRGQIIAGYKEGDSTFGTLGGLIGSLTHLHSTGNHTLTVGEIPKHGHWILALNKDSNGYNYSSDMDYDSPGSKCVIDYATTCNTDTLGWGNSVGIQMTGGNQGHTHGDTSFASSVQPTIVLNWIVKAFQLMPNQSYVSTVSQDSDINTYSCNYINKISDYSTEEQVIGKWIDGKPLYRKIVSIVLSDVTEDTIVNIRVNHNIQNMEYGFVEMATRNLSTGDTYSYGSSGYINAANNRTQWFLNRTQISASTSRSIDNGTWYVSLCYTKTTD